MAARHRPPPMVLPRSDMQPLRPVGDIIDSSEPSDMLGPLHEHSDIVVSNRAHHGQEDRLPPAPEVLHVALVVPDLKLYGILRKAAWLIQPAGWTGSIKLHVIQQRPDTTPEELVYRFALASLGLITPQTAALQYPETLEIGWNDDLTPENKLLPTT